MNNLGAFYRQQYDEAHESAEEGKLDAALDRCFELRMYPDLGHFHLALVNLLIACIADPAIHDTVKFATEAWNLAQRIRTERYLEGDLGIANSPGAPARKLMCIAPVNGKNIEKFEKGRYLDLDALGEHAYKTWIKIHQAAHKTLQHDGGVGSSNDHNTAEDEQAIENARIMAIPPLSRLVEWDRPIQSMESEDNSQDADDGEHPSIKDGWQEGFLTYDQAVGLDHTAI